MKLSTKLVTASLFAVLAIVIVWWAPRARKSPPADALRILDGEIHLRASVHPHAMERPFGQAGHHLIVSDRGRARFWALFRSMADDDQVRAALGQLGAVPGENLPAESWTEVDDPASPAPDLRVEGTAIEVSVTWPGRTPVALGELLEETVLPPLGLDIRFGGNQRHRERFRSGCIVCSASCPGGAMSNRNRTLREHLEHASLFRARTDLLPPSGTEVTLVLRPRL